MDILDDMGVSKLSAKVFLKVIYSFKFLVIDARGCETKIADDSFQQFRFGSFFLNTFYIYKQLYYTLHKRSYSKKHNRGSLIEVEVTLYCYLVTSEISHNLSIQTYCYAILHVFKRRSDTGCHCPPVFFKSV